MTNPPPNPPNRVVVEWRRSEAAAAAYHLVHTAATILGALPNTKDCRASLYHALDLLDDLHTDNQLAEKKADDRK